MKLFATLFLSAVTTASLFAASIPRCDVSGVNKTGNVKLTPGTVEGGMKVIHQTWGDQATRQHRISATDHSVTNMHYFCMITIHNYPLFIALSI